LEVEKPVEQKIGQKGRVQTPEFANSRHMDTQNTLITEETVESFYGRTTLGKESTKATSK
jgi:hypothetical protein